MIEPQPVTEQQLHDFVERLWLEVARCDVERERWSSHPEIARQYAGERRAYRAVIDDINRLRFPPGAPGVAERETQPPGEPVPPTP